LIKLHHNKKNNEKPSSIRIKYEFLRSNLNFVVMKPFMLILGFLCFRELLQMHNHHSGENEFCFFGRYFNLVGVAPFVKCPKTFCRGTE